MFELRLLFFHGLFLLVAVFAMIYFFMINEILKSVFCLIVIMTLLPIVLIKNKIKFYDDFCVLFAWRVIGVLPVFVDYSNILSVEICSKHKVVIKTKGIKNKKICVFVFDSDLFVEKINSKI